MLTSPTWDKSPGVFQIWGRFTRNLHSQVFLGLCVFGCLHTITCLSHNSTTCCDAQPFLWFLWTTLTYPATHAHQEFGISFVYLVGQCEGQHDLEPHLPPHLALAILKSFLPGCPQRAKFCRDIGTSFSSDLDRGNWVGRGAHLYSKKLKHFLSREIGVS